MIFPPKDTCRINNPDKADGIINQSLKKGFYNRKFRYILV